MIHVQPSELQLKCDPTSATGYTLCYIQQNQASYTESSGELTQRIDQCTLELYQGEIAQIEPAVLRQLAACCINDFRTIFLCHDKRILGIVLEELPSLVQRQRLTPQEAAQLEAGIATTLLPGTEAMKSLLEQSSNNPQLKDNYIIKPIRDGSCQGIQLGSQISQAQWLDALERLSRSPLLPHEDACIIQELVKHVWYDVVRHDVEQVPGGEKFHLIGTGHMINSQLYVHGPWRIGLHVHVGVGGSKGIIMSTVLRPDLPTLDGEEEEQE